MATIGKDVFTVCSDLQVEIASADSDGPSTNNNNEFQEMMQVGNL